MNNSDRDHRSHRDTLSTTATPRAPPRARRVPPGGVFRDQNVPKISVTDILKINAAQHRDVESHPERKVNAMSDRTLVLAIFDNEATADNAAAALKDSGLTSTDAIGVLAVDATGKLKEEKVGARSTGKGAGIGAALFLLGPAAIGVGVLGGAAAGACTTRGWD